MKAVTSARTSSLLVSLKISCRAPGIDPSVRSVAADLPRCRRGSPAAAPVRRPRRAPTASAARRGRPRGIDVMQRSIASTRRALERAVPDQRVRRVRRADLRVAGQRGGVDGDVGDLVEAEQQRRSGPSGRAPARTARGRPARRRTAGRSGRRSGRPSSGRSARRAAGMVGAGAVLDGVQVGDDLLEVRDEDPLARGPAVPHVVGAVDRRAVAVRGRPRRARTGRCARRTRARAARRSAVRRPAMRGR